MVFFKKSDSVSSKYQFTKTLGSGSFATVSKRNGAMVPASIIMAARGTTLADTAAGRR